jgi:hypothetical protein
VDGAEGVMTNVRSNLVGGYYFRLKWDWWSPYGLADLCRLVVVQDLVLDAMWELPMSVLAVCRRRLKRFRR